MSEKQPLLFLAYLDEWAEAIQLQLEADAERWGPEYLNRTRKGQAQRIFARLFRYFWNWLLYREHIEWKKVAGLAFIAWLRETHPELSEEWTEPDDWDDSVPVVLVPLETGKVVQVGGSRQGDPNKATYEPPIAQMQKGTYHKIMAERQKKAQNIQLGDVGLDAQGTVKDADGE